MEIFGGFMVMMSIIGLFLAVIWLIMPFVVFAIKGKQDRTLEVLESIEKRLADLESSIHPPVQEQIHSGSSESSDPSTEASLLLPKENAVPAAEPAHENKGAETVPAVENPGGLS
jgi:hypothetical protein